MNTDETGLLISTGLENSNEFATAFGSREYLPISLLRREKVIRIRDCCVRNISQKLWLNFNYDIDGIVATLSTFRSVTTPFSFIRILPRERNSLIPVFDIIRKHLPLPKYNRTALQYLKWSASIKLFDGDGFDFHLALLPRTEFHIGKRYKRKDIEEIQYEFYSKFRENFAVVVQSLSSINLSRGTFKKNCIFDIRQWHILSDDRDFILGLLDEALDNTKYEPTFETYILAFKLGDRDSTPNLAIKAFKVSEAVISIHSAITISSPVLNQNLLWSRYGIQSLVGDRGSIFSALSFSSCCNFQTNLDGCLMDISGELRHICRNPDKLTFLQFYADIPHLNRNYIHPVYGAIASCGVLHENVMKSLERKSEQYISLIKENTVKLSRVNARVEIVCIANISSNIFSARQFICKENLGKLIEKYPLIIPFSDRIVDDPGKNFTHLLKSVPKHIHETLEELYSLAKRKGGFLEVWKTYQYEIANEIFWKGRSNAYIDNTFAINLGPGGSSPSRSLTWEKGFLCLEDATICALNDRSIPPPIFCSLKESERQKLRRMCTFVDVIQGSHNVVGKRAVLLLLQDILADPCRTADCDRSFISDLKTDFIPRWGKLSGSIGTEQLANKLCKREVYKHPYVFGRVLELIEESGKNTNETILAGLHQMKLKYFPDVRYRDRSGNPKMNWSGYGVLQVASQGSAIDNEELAIEMSREVVWYLDNHGIVYRSKFVQFLDRCKAFIFPWMYEILVRLGKSYLQKNEYIALLSYLTCIGLLQNHWYVDYRRFINLYHELHSLHPSLTKDLQQHEVLSVFTLACQVHLKVNRLHESLPLNLQEEPQFESDKNQESEQEMEEESKYVDNCLNTQFESEEFINRGTRKHVSAGVRGRWDPKELEIIYSVIRMNTKKETDAYACYLRQCDSCCVPDRSFQSFKAKYHRMIHNITN